MLGGVARHEVTGEGGLPKGKQQAGRRPDRTDLIHGVASLTAPLAQPAAVRSPQTPSLRSVEGGQVFGHP